MQLLIFSVLMAVGIAEPLPSPERKNNYVSHLMFDFDYDPPKANFYIKKYPHEKWCHYFYNLETEGMYTVRQCPKGEMFDYHFHVCKEKSLAQCWSHKYGKTEVHNEIHSKWRKHFRCPFSSGKYPDVFDCEKFFLCEEGQAKHKHCPKYKMFDRILRHCVSDNVALCADATDAVDIDHRCPKSSGNFGHPKDCSKYYYCRKGKPELRKCENMTLFHEAKGRCRNRKHVHCGYRHNPFKQGRTAKNILKEKKRIVETYNQLKEVTPKNNYEKSADLDIVLVDSNVADNEEYIPVPKTLEESKNSSLVLKLSTNLPKETSDTTTTPPNFPSEIAENLNPNISNSLQKEIKGTNDTTNNSLSFKSKMTKQQGLNKFTSAPNEITNEINFTTENLQNFTSEIAEKQNLKTAITVSNETIVSSSTTNNSLNFTSEITKNNHSTTQSL